MKDQIESLKPLNEVKKPNLRTNEPFNQWFKPHKQKVCEYLKSKGINPNNDTRKLCFWFSYNIHPLREMDSDEIISLLEKKRSFGVAYTLESSIFNWGEEEGTRRWERYCKAQADSNTFEYKAKKFGMTKEQFDEYNKSRAVTKENLINRWGEEEGLKKWNDYCHRQVYTKSLPYFVEKYGEEEGKARFDEINSQKALTLENFIRKYGETEGTKKFKEIRGRQISKAEKNFIELLESKLPEKLLPFGKKQYKIIKENRKGHFFCDYVNTELGICVEYNGVFWHAKPAYYDADDVICHGLTASDIWEKDERKHQAILEDPNIDKLFVIWEDNEEAGLREILDYVENFK